VLELRAEFPQQLVHFTTRDRRFRFQRALVQVLLSGKDRRGNGDLYQPVQQAIIGRGTSSAVVAGFKGEYGIVLSAEEDPTIIDVE
jgi:hypothetical protein